MKKRKSPNPASKEPSARIVAAPDKHLIAKADGPRSFIVAAPVYDHRSAGIRVLHTLCNELNRCGHEAYLLFYQFRPEGGQNFYWSDGTLGYNQEHASIKRFLTPTSPELLQEMVANSYVVYPEVIQGNPLAAPRVIRYVLNNPASNTYPMLHGATDFITSFHPSYWPNPNHQLPIFFEDTNFHDRETAPTLERKMDCTYIGKGSKLGECFKIPGTVMIERVWPADRESLAVLLRNTRYFYTWDRVTQTNADAIRCGAIPVMLGSGSRFLEIPSVNGNPLPYAEITIQGSSAIVTLNNAEYESRREEFLRAYSALTDKTRDNVLQFATAVEAYFQ